MTEQTIEQMAAQTILEQPQEIIIDGVAYKMGDPSIATLILVSEIISRCPRVEYTEDGKDQLLSVLHHAKDFRLLGDIAATLILGAKNIYEYRPKKRSLWRFWRKDDKDVVEIDRRKELSWKLLQRMDSATLWDLIQSKLLDIGIGYFFSATTSLSEANILRPTRKEVVETEKTED